MRLSTHLKKILTEALTEHRIVVWYDRERAFGEFVSNFAAPQTRVVNAASSELQARRAADAVYRNLNEAGSPDANSNLLIYVPRARVVSNEQTQDPFLLFAVAGGVFGESESEQLQALAKAAMPDLVEKIDTVFMTAQPTFALLDALKRDDANPLLEQAIGTQSILEAVTRVLADEHAVSQIERTPGARAEFLRLLETGLGFKTSAGQDIKTLRESLARYVLLSELAFDLPASLPASLANVTRADFAQRDRIYQICDRWRGTDAFRDSYIVQANQIETALHLSDQFHGITELGVRDTFAFEERQYVTALTAQCESDRLDAAREILEARRKSVWRYLPERAQVWQVAERALDLLEAANLAVTDLPNKLAPTIDQYARADGRYELDQKQRVMEQSYADCVDCGPIQPVVERARRRYRDAIDQWQTHFLRLIQNEGYPPESILRQTQIFDRYVAPALDRRDKVVYVMADSLRFEMGRALAKELDVLGDVTLQPAAAALPTVTMNGMAALLPGADGALTLKTVNDALVPYIGERALKDSAARMQYLSEKYGDRFQHMTLGEWLDLTETKRKNIATRAGLLVLRVPDIDELGEHVSARQARKHISDLLGDLKTAAVHLARHGFQLIVFAADHGHVLFPEVLPGDVLTMPLGTWALNKRRSLLGSFLRDKKNSVLLKPEQVGIQTDATDFALAPGFSVYVSDATYFHEGVSLQECIVPVIELRVKGAVPAAGKKQQIEIRYRSNRFTSQVIGLKVRYDSMFGEPLSIRLEAYDAANPKGAPIGEAADSEARDENTHEVLLQPNQEANIPLLISSEFHGEAVEIRALSSDRQVTWATLNLMNGILD